jgi:hypothetical protein
MSATPAGALATSRRARIDWLPVTIAVAAFSIALAVRWNVAGDGVGRSFLPRPDAIEYAAGAQALAQEGTYLLRVGEVRMRPRYPPGLSLLLAPALRLGVPGEALWRVSAGAGAALAALLSALAWRLVSICAGPRSRQGAAVAATVAGGLWSVAPAAFVGGTRIMSDDAATLFAFATLAAFAGALTTLAHGRAPAMAVAAGACFVTTAAIRPPVALLLAVPMGVFAVSRLRRRPFARWGGLAVAGVCGAALPAALVAAVLVRSGESPWRWSAYALWDPLRFGPHASSFAWKYFWSLDAEFARSGRGDLTGLALGARLLLGLPANVPQESLGELWPALSLVGILAIGWIARRRRDEPAQMLSAMAVAALAWIAVNLLFWGAYYYPSARFFLPLLALSTLVVAGLAGCCWELLASRRRMIVLALVAIALSTLRLAVAAREAMAHVPRFGPEMVRERVEAWWSLSDEERARGRVEFDPLEAQALGLLSPERMRSIREWGELPPTPHVRILRAMGRLPPALTSGEASEAGRVARGR